MSGVYPRYISGHFLVASFSSPTSVYFLLLIFNPLISNQNMVTPGRKFAIFLEATQMYFIIPCKTGTSDYRVQRIRIKGLSNIFF